MKTKYGDFSPTQISSVKKSIQKAIFYLLLYVDPQTKDGYNVDVNEAFYNLQLRLNGLNSILLNPPELVVTMSYLESAQQIYNGNFNFSAYRKLILDAGAEIMRIKDGD